MRMNLAQKIAWRLEVWKERGHDKLGAHLSAPYRTTEELHIILVSENQCRMVSQNVTGTCVYVTNQLLK